MKRLTRQQLEQERKDTARYALGNVTLDTTRLLLIYARQSSIRQYVNNVYSALEQRDGLIERAHDLGWVHNEQWILYIENQLAKKTQVSGSLRIDQRPGLQALTDVIDSGKASAILVVDVDRITRDPDMITPVLFANKCKQANVLIITDEYTYDFNNPTRNDMGKFMQEADRAKEYIRKQIRGKMLKNRTRKANLGLVANGNAPVGLQLDDTRDNLIPSVHASQVDWLYARYRAHDANLTGLLREVVGMALQGIPLFPYDDSIDAKSMHMGLVNPLDEKSGWTIKSRHGLTYILSNPMYAGHLVFNGRIVKRNAHVAIVDPDNWQYAFDRLASVTLDGDEIERTERTVRYTRTGSSNNALLSGVRDDGTVVIDGLNGCHVYYNHARETYILTRRDGVHTVNGFETSIKASELDGIVTEHLLFWLEMSRLKPSHNTGYTAMNKIKNVQPTGTVSDDLALTNVKLAKVERALRTSQDVMDDDELRETFASKARLIKRVSELEAIRDSADRQAKKRAQAKEDIETASSKWAGWSIEERRSFIRLVMDSITLEEIASGWLKVTITWSTLMGWFANKGIKNPDAYYMQAVGYIWRQSGGVWSDTELDVLRASYPTMPRMELLRLLPSRSWLSIMTRAARLDPHVTRINTSREPLPIPDDTSLTDEQVISEFMLERESIQRKRIQWHTDLLPNASNLSQ